PAAQLEHARPRSFDRELGAEAPGHGFVQRPVVDGLLRREKPVVGVRAHAALGGFWKYDHWKARAKDSETAAVPMTAPAVPMGPGAASARASPVTSVPNAFRPNVERGISPPRGGTRVTHTTYA